MAPYSRSLTFTAQLTQLLRGTFVGKSGTTVRRLLEPGLCLEISTCCSRCATRMALPLEPSRLFPSGILLAIWAFMIFPCPTGPLLGLMVGPSLRSRGSTGCWFPRIGISISPGPLFGLSLDRGLITRPSCCRPSLLFPRRTSSSLRPIGCDTQRLGRLSLGPGPRRRSREARRSTSPPN